MPATITGETVEEKLKQVLPRFGIDASQVTRVTTFEELDLDSLDIAELSQIIEDDFGIRLSSDDLDALKSIDDTIDLVLSRAP
jgi:acyl carrier protein